MNRGLSPSIVAGAAIAFFSQIGPAAAQGTTWGVAWTTIPSVVILSNERDRRVQMAREAIEFWNRTLSELESSFRFGPVTRQLGAIPGDELKAMSSKVLSRTGPPELKENVRAVRGDVVLVLSDDEFVSFVGRWPEHSKALVAIQTDTVFPLAHANVTPNVIAHELGHAIGLGHNDDPSMLMCGRPAPCRPHAFKSNTNRFFPLTSSEKASLLRMYPVDWKGG